MDERAAQGFKDGSGGRGDGPAGQRVLVAGCGAIGSVFACLLARGGARVDVLGRGAHLEAIRERGAEVVGIWGEHHAAVARALTDPRDATGPYDAVLVCCKSFDTDELLGSLDPACLADGGAAVSLQNGLGNVEKIAARFGETRTLGGRVIFGVDIPRPGRARVTVEAEPTLLGPVDPGGGLQLAERWATRVDAAGVPCSATDAIAAALWAKAFYNAALNPMGALLGLAYGELPRDPERRAVMDRVIDEAFAVAVAEGARLPWADASAYREHFYGKLLPATVAHRSSMLQDLERGRRTEIDAICGEICRRGDARGVDVSANRVLLALVRSRAEAGAAPSGGSGPPEA